MVTRTDHHSHGHRAHDHAVGDHDHHHGSGHHHFTGSNEHRLGLAALLTGGFMVLEFAGGLLTGSLALIADSGHMLSDFAALSLAWFAVRLSRRPADWHRTYGFDRFSILVAFSNGLALIAIAVWITVEAVHRLLAPPVVLGGEMLAIAAVGLAVNIAVFLMLSHGGERNLNVRAALLHVAGDLLGSLAAICAAIVILASGWTMIDPLLSVLVSLIILKSAVVVIKQSAHILLEGAPAGLDTRTIADDLKRHVSGVDDVHHVHLWSITEERPMITLHARIVENGLPDQIVTAIKKRLETQFKIGHATIELEIGACADRHCVPH